MSDSRNSVANPSTEGLLVDRMKRELAAELAEQPELATTFHITRFLRARNNDFEKAKFMLLNYLAHRKARHLPSLAHKILAKGHRTIWQEAYPQSFCTHDYSGRPVMVTQVGHYDYKRISKTFTTDDILDFFTFNQEQFLFTEFPLASFKAGRRVERMIVIADLKGMKVMDISAAKSRKFLDTISKLFQDYYPELIEKSIVVNAPLGMGFIWSVAKKMIDKKTAEKFEIFSDNGHKYLSQIMDVRKLPGFLGGQGSGALKDFKGPTWAEKEEGWKLSRVTLEDRTPEYQYYYTEGERRALIRPPPLQKQSIEPPEEKPVSAALTSTGVSGNAPSVFSSISSHKKKPRNSTYAVRVENYFPGRTSMTQSQQIRPTQLD